MQVSCFVRYYNVDSEGNRSAVAYESALTGSHTMVRNNLVSLAAETDLADCEVEYTITGNAQTVPAPLAQWWAHL